ncbi:MAG: hypothetical protein ACTHJ5_18720 [Ilyomonas sp.]
MKKWAAIILFSVYLFGATDAYQVLKLPLLITHFIQHKEESPNITITAFLKMHYCLDVGIDSDYQQDMKLPFKTHETECCLTIATIITEPVELKAKAPENALEKYRLKNENVPAYTAYNSIFQPPRLA